MIPESGLPVFGKDHAQETLFQAVRAGAGDFNDRQFRRKA
jgi:hypothetical protein